MNIQQLDDLYKMYRFQILPTQNKNLRVYSFTSKYFSNADVILLNSLPTSEINKATKEIEALGFSVKVRDYKTILDAEENLFDGFFDIKGSNELLKRMYKEYVTKIEDKTLFGKYEYIKSEFYDLEDNALLSTDIVKTITQNLKDTGPVLVLVEAAAGFGKTSTSYEIIKHFSEDPESKKVPLFTELSRSRQATIFKYVLYDEINTRFTGLSLELINKHIIEGRVPVIIDGFDELFKPRSSERSEDKFADAEPMLHTIKELLKGEAKIVLTTRRTAIFSDDEFFKWLENNSNQFKFYSYQLLEPTISDWISPAREKALKKAGLNLKSISSPVLLAYLKSMDDEQFDNCIRDIDKIIEDYINRLIDRENERQNLKMDHDEQRKILKVISSHFTNADITSESKEVLEKIILEKEQNLLLNVLGRFIGEERPSIEQLVNKLTLHAFLDRKNDGYHQIGFVNEFILGSFIGANLLEEGDKWLGMERFIDFIMTAYIPRSLSIRTKIYEILNKELLKYVDIEKQVYIDNYLYGRINRPLDNQFFKDLEFRKSFNNKQTIKDCFFSDCEFYEINLSEELATVQEVHFINCHFFDCILNPKVVLDNNIHFTNCSFTPEIELEKEMDSKEEITTLQSSTDIYQKKVLERFWQSGRDSFIPYRRIGTLRLGIPREEIPLVDEAINELIKKDIIIQKNGHHSVHLNVRHINEIKKILGR